MNQRMVQTGFLFVVTMALIFLSLPSAAGTPLLPTALTVNITDLVPITLNPGPNKITFFGDQSRHPEDIHYPGQLDFFKIYHFPVQLVVNVFDAQEIWRLVKIDTYFVTAPWISKAYLVQLVSPGDIPENSNTNLYWIHNQITGSAGDDQTPMFFQGKLNGQRQTFLIIATRQYPLARPDKLPTAFPYDPLPTVVTVYKFYAGTDLADYEPNLDDGPEFQKIDQFEPATPYCSSYNAITFSLQHQFSPAVSKQFLNFSDGTRRRDSLACSGDED